MKAEARLDHQLVALEREHTVHVMLELTAPPAEQQAGRQPLSLALVLDRSGSMTGAKLETTKACARFLAERLDPRDRLGVVIYDDRVETLYPLGAVDRAVLLPLLESVQSRGSTNLSGGWLKGMEMLRNGSGRKAKADAGPRKVLLLTDGLANVGITDRDSLATMAKNSREAGVGSSTIGFGDGFDEELLTAMADAGGGRSYYAATPDEAPAIFAEEFEGLTSMVAQNLTAEIRPGGHVSVVGILNEYPAVGVTGGIQVDMGDVYADDRRRLVFELVVPALATMGPATVADVVVRYVTVGEQVELRELTAPIAVHVVDAKIAGEEIPDADVTEEVVVLKAAKARDEARAKADRGEFDAAKAVLNDAAEMIRSVAPNSKRAVELLAEADGLNTHAAAMAPGTYMPANSKSLHYESYTTRRGRKK